MDTIKFDTPLCELAYKYGSDKCPQISHGYTPRYYKMFDWKRREIKKVLEIGIGNPEIMTHSPHYRTGASLYMWRDYFPNATIFGVDILKECMFVDKNIRTYLCDQSKKEDVENILRYTGTDIDIVIDDGSHVPAHQILTCLTLMPYLPKNVVYVIEDILDGAVMDKIREAGWNVYYKMLTKKKGFGDRMAVITYPVI